MRLFAATLVSLLAVGGGLRAEEASARHGIAPDLKAFPQGTPKEALASVLKAIEAKRIDYLLAQLTDPNFVDERIKRLFDGKFAPQVEETKAKLSPFVVRQLKGLQEKGEWVEGEGRATLRLKDAGDRLVIFKKIGERWYLENQNRPARAQK